MGMHGWKHVNRAIQSADLLIAIGMRFDDRVTGNVRTYAPHARIIHVDIDPAEIGKNVAVEVPIVGDAKRSSPRSRGSARRSTRGSARRTSTSWPSGAERLGGQLLARVRRVALRPPHRRLRHRADRRADRARLPRTSADVGQNQMWLARYAGFRRPNSHISSGGLGTMGFAVPAAMGAALGNPTRRPGRSSATAASR
jgi:acetolactate synthase I/II/III large subunit